LKKICLYLQQFIITLAQEPSNYHCEFCQNFTLSCAISIL